MASTAKARVRPGRGIASGWLVGPTMLAATVCGAILVLRGPDRAFAVALAAFLAMVFAWLFVSVLWPARADRTCRACGKPALRRLDGESTRGVACTACGQEDPHTSSFLLAEEEGVAIEPIRLAERGSRP